MSPSTPVNGNPKLLIADTDALVQLTASDNLSTLRLLKSNYGIQTVITEPVEIELRNVLGSVRFRDTKHLLLRAVTNNLISILDQSMVAGIVGADKAPDAFKRIEDSADELYRLGVGEGEAYSHAASMELTAPVLSNDKKAIKDLLNQQIPLLQPYHLRFYDLMVFAVQTGHLTHNNCDATRQSLTTRGENIEKCFMGRSFSDGLPNFYPRLACGNAPAIGSAVPVNKYDTARMVVTPSRSVSYVVNYQAP